MTDETADRMGRTIVRLLRARSTVMDRRTDMAALYNDLKAHADPHHQHAEWRRVFAAALGCEQEINGDG